MECFFSEISCPSPMEALLSTLLPSLVKKGVFGDVEFVDIKYDNKESIGAQFASSLVFVTLIVKGSREESLRLLVKVPVSIRRDTLLIFQIELLMYSEVLPALGYNQEYYPKFHYGSVDCENPQNSIIILENIKSRKFDNSKVPIFLDYDHISLVMKNIAKFHALSFVLKHENAEKFEELIKKLKEYYSRSNEKIKLETNVSAQTSIRAFAEKHGNEELLDKFLNAMGKPYEVEEKLSVPIEPFSVICHGDFCNNNVMYKYDKEGIPIECAFIDFQTTKYSSLVTDISFFLYLNTDGDIREKYWDKFLKIYWETLRETVPNHINVPRFESFLEHFSQFAAYGFNISTFFLPLMMDPLPLEKILVLTDDEADERRRSPKGLEIQKRVVDLVSHFYHKKYIQPFLDCMNKP